LVKILVVDDDPALLGVLETGLRLSDDCQLIAVGEAAVALEHLRRERFDLVVTDYALGDPKLTGLDVMESARKGDDPPLVIIITAYATLEITMKAIKLGAYDFLTKPFQLEELQLVVRNALAQITLERENRELRQQVTELVGAVGEMETRQRELLERLRQLDETFGMSKGTSSPMADPLGGVQVHGLQRRQVREQLASYTRLAATLCEQVQRERRRIGILYEKGFLPEEEYDRLMKSRETAEG
jgi:DNA-binding response OmpR family regulator